MSGKIIDGKDFSKNYTQQLKERVTRLKSEYSVIPGLAVILVGNSPASVTYVKNKTKACDDLGIYSQQYSLPESTTEAQLFELIDELNHDSEVHGILIQLPLPKHLNESAVSNRINPNKDVDAIHKENFGSVMVGDYSLLPCTAAGILKLIKSIDTEITGKECVIVGRSNIVGKPIAMLMLHENATITICHSKTKKLREHCLSADILIAAVGIPKFITADMIKPGAIVIDAGINRDENGELCGDVDYIPAKEIAGFITPVPGGVGPMTITMLMNNTLLAVEKLLANN